MRLTAGGNQPLRNGSAGAIAVLGSSEKGGLLHALDCYMETIIVGPSSGGNDRLTSRCVQKLSFTHTNARPCALS